MIDASTNRLEADRAAASIALAQLSAEIGRAYEVLFHEHGLTRQQFNVLRILRGADRAGEPPLPTMTVGERMIEPEPGITRLMGRLEDKGLVLRHRCPSDARCVRCSVTPAGLAALAALDAPLAALNADLFSRLTDADVAVLTDLLSRALPDTPPSRCPA